MIMKFKLFFILSIISINTFATVSLTVTSPKESVSTVSYPVVYFEGYTENAQRVLVNGIEVPVNYDGTFKHTVYLTSKKGKSYFLIEAKNGTDYVQETRTIYYDKTGKFQQKTIRNTPEVTTKSTPQEELTHQQLVQYLRNYIGEDAVSSYTFSDIRLDDYIKIFAKEHKLNIINHVERETPLTIVLNDIHPVDLFNSLIQYWGCTWVYKDQIIQIIDQTPVRVFQLDYIDGNNLIGLIQNLSTIKDFKVNPIDNSLVAKGSPAELAYLESLIDELDVKPKQVLIEATIIETNVDLANALGIDPSSIVKTSQEDNGSIFNLKTLGYSFPINSIENNSNTNILANPQILVTNHSKASINTGNRIGYSTSTVTETSTIENIQFLTTGITLEITPHIADNGEILMEIKPSISEGQVNNNRPMSSNTSTDTQVIIKDGETIIIGGLIQKKRVKVKQHIPILSDIPIVNMLFSKTDTTEQKMELSVLITPHIVKDSLEGSYEQI